ncbi:MAG: aryl-sulfate sulfotransferase [Chthoniobacterales bacterium]
MKTWIVIISAAFSLIFSGESLAVQPLVAIDKIIPGPTPFISFVTLKISDPINLSTVSFTIRPKQGSQTRPVSATYTSAYLQREGYFQPALGNRLTLPVFGLYQNRQNTVTVISNFTTGATQRNKVQITAAAYDGGTYTSPTIVAPRLQNTTLSYDFVLMKGSVTNDTPVIIDSDSEVRWVGSASHGGQQSLLFDNGIYCGTTTGLLRLEFDGRSAILADYSNLGVINVHHNFDYGRDGIVMEVDTTSWAESVDMEVDAAGNVLRTWNLADIVSAAMTAGGDDPSLFVFPGPADWFHNNATAYRASDDSLIVSSRENFVIALDYDTGRIKWILGDSTKHWYEFPSLRAFALRLGPDTLAPIGQHATSFFQDELLLFDDGTPSLTQMPPGEGRTYSAPRRYSIVGNKATEVWHYLADPSIYSAFCSSVYEDTADNYLIDYTMDGPNTDLVALDATGSIAFFYQYVANGCGTAFYADPIHLENMQFN